MIVIVYGQVKVKNAFAEWSNVSQKLRNLKLKWLQSIVFNVFCITLFVSFLKAKQSSH